MAESAKKKAERHNVTAMPDLGGDGASAPAPEDPASHRASACPVALCPICAAVSLIQPLSPDVVEHLLNAGREFLLAAKAALDAISSDDSKNDDGSFEKIDIG
ncbi:MAG: hypothetical protein QOE83_1247 [Actinomycetota bacterium]|jgi:hypothetical protein|nr:hypothetical protein [Actinomycetota bacterium]